MTTLTPPAFQVGDAVRVHRNEKAFPSKGTWPRYREQPGFVVMVNSSEDTEPPEYGVVLTIHRPPWRQGRKAELIYDSDAVKWFAGHELIARQS